MQARVDAQGSAVELICGADTISDVCTSLASVRAYHFAGLIVEEEPDGLALRYVFHPDERPGWVHAITRYCEGEAPPSVSACVHAADWHEREAEDLFGITFRGHPRLGDFVLHDDRWQEDLAPMRCSFDGSRAVADREPNLRWNPRRIVHAPGAFAMPVGPIYGGVTEPAHFLLETVGEDVIRTIPRLFYKFRAVEKIAEGRTIRDGLLLAERFSATTAFAHALAYCQAAEAICGVEVPPQGRVARAFLAEIERARHHIGAIHDICESTGLAVATSQAAILEEELLRLSCTLTGHRYLFGLAVLGGLSRQIDTEVIRQAAMRVREILASLDGLERALQSSSSFLDRLEQVGTVSASDAREHALVGPVARASGVARDMRRIEPYSGYDSFDFDVPREDEGDGYARLRVLFAETRQSARIIEQAAARWPSGRVREPDVKVRAGAALGCVEAPRGAALHWLRIGEDGRISRYHVVPPSFANWHGFHLAAENFAFQDFPIILATYDLSVAENDR